MEDHAVLNITLSVLTLLFTATLIAFALRKSKIPFTVVLVLAGLGLGFLSENVSTLDFLQNFRLSPDLIFYIFLPTLIFESAFHMNLKHFGQTIVTTSVISTVGMIMSMGMVAAGTVYFLGFPWSVGLLFGALISATDPVSVLSLFKQVGAPKRLSVIVEGESLFNDGTALVLFGIFIEGFRGLSSTIESFLTVAIGGLVIGAALGFIFSKSLDYVKNSKEIEISITLILAHATFIIAEYFFGVSGILATVVAGIVIGNYGAFKISPNVKEIMTHFWDYAAFLANSILFLLVGIIIYSSIHSIGSLLPSLAIVIAVVLVARMIMVYTVIPLVNFLYPYEKTPLSWMHVIQWSGLRGALGIALILTLPPELPYYNELLIFTVGVIFFTIIVNGLTIRPLLSICGLQNLNTIDSFKFDEHKIMIGQKVSEKLKEMKDRGFIAKGIYDKVQKKYRDYCKEGSKHVQSLFKECRRELSAPQLSEVLKQHLLEIEYGVFTELYYHGEISQELLNVLLSNIDQQRSKRSSQKVAIGRLTFMDPNWKIIKFLSKIGFSEIENKLIRENIFLRYEMYRARLISSSDALKVIKEVKKTKTFMNKQVLEKHEARYKAWHKNAKKKLKYIKSSHPELTEKIEIYLAEKAAFHQEHKMIKRLKKLESVSGRVLNNFREDLEKREKRAHKELMA